MQKKLSITAKKKKTVHLVTCMRYLFLQIKERKQIYGGYEGPLAMYVKLVSSDGHEFFIKREYALTSGTIKAMLSGPGQFAENEANEVNFREIPSHVLQKVCMYFAYKVRYTHSSTEIPEFPIAPEIALELLMAGNFLDC
ncbi:transcription elongation factor elongin C isoform X2 [Augochlora pura]